MSIEGLISLQSSGVRSIDEPQTPRPGGVPQGSVLVILDVNKNISPGALYWALSNVVRKGDNLKIVGIITHISNPMGFMSRVDQNSWIGSNGLQLQHEIETKKEALENIAYVREWCDKAGVNWEVDVKAGFHTKQIAVDEAKAIGAYHVVLDKNMKKDRKYFVDNLTCFVSRARNSGGVDTIRSFSVNKQLPPMVPAPPSNTKPGQPVPSSRATTGSVHSHGGSSTSSASFEFGGESSDDFNTQDSDQLSAPTTGESIERPEQENGSRMQMPFPIRTTPELGVSKLNARLNNGTAMSEAEAGYKLINPLRKPALRKWLNEDDQRPEPFYEQQGFLPDRGGNGNKIQPVANEQFQRSIIGYPERSVVQAPPAKVPLPPGRLTMAARLPAQVAKLPSPPLSRMPSPPASISSQSSRKSVWVWTRSKEAMRAAVEAGWTTFIFTPDTKHLAPEWTSIEWIKPLYLEGGRFLNQDGKQVALLGQVYSGEQLDYLPAMMGGAEIVVINDLDWQIIPPEDVVAAFQGRRTELFATAGTAADAQVYLEALEVGTDGVVLHTDDLSEISALKAYLNERKVERAQERAALEPPIKEVGQMRVTDEPVTARSDTVNSSVPRVGSSPRSDSNPLNRVGSSPRSDTNPLNRVGSSPRLADTPAAQGAANNGFRLVDATVKRVDPVGMGDRVCLDLCNLLNSGEALLVGSFAKAMFLVHAEVQDGNGSRRSFRVNAGPVHAYTAMAGGQITYLSELESGGQVMAVDAHGNCRTVLVGRVQIETKPLVLIVAEAEGQSYSVMLQTADSVRLVVPSDMQGAGNEAIPVTQLRQGDTILLSIMQDDDCSYEK